MTDTAPQGAPQGQQAPPADTGQAPDSGQGSNEYSLASDFLQQIPEADREVVGRYVPAWDAGVTRRFQALHQEYNPYKELGDPETLQQALQVYRLMEESPEVIYAILAKELASQQEPQGFPQQGFQQGQFQPQAFVPPTQGFTPPGYQPPPVGGGFQQPPVTQPSQFQVPPELMQKIELQETVLGQVAQFVIDQQRQSQEAQEDMALERELTLLKTQYGDFDEDYVLSLMEKGVDADSAVKSWHGKVQELLNQAGQATNNLPPVLTGGGAPPGEQQTVQTLDRKSTKDLVANLVAQAAANEN